MRLIDADPFAEALWNERDRLQAFMNECAERGMWTTRYETKIERNTIEGIVQAMNEEPTIDAVPVIWCKECKWQGDDEHCPVCNSCGRGNLPSGEWYCADGERKDDE